MTPEFFRQQIQELNNSFSTPYTERQVGALWRRFRHVAEKRFAEAVDKLVIEETRRPSLGAFDAALNNQARPDAREDKILPQDFTCNLCTGTGRLFAIKRGSFAEFGFRCSCKRGAELDEPILPRWESYRERDFAPIPVWATLNQIAGVKPPEQNQDSKLKKEAGSDMQFATMINEIPGLDQRDHPRGKSSQRGF